ncbi:MAG: hypothetical protein KG029_10945 [Bacteroidetes bacterium]|nr:hypothetical protein [Bacteroidota bacterium]
MEESIKQLALISSVLGGFSFTFLSAIITKDTEKRIKYWLIITLTIASISFLLGAVGWTLMDFNQGMAALNSHHQMLVKVLIFGLISILSSIGLSGWLNDRKTGITTSILGVLALLFLLFGILSRYIEL